MRLEFQKLIKQAKIEGISLKEIQSEWENTFKPQIEEMLRNAEQYQVGLTEQEKKEGERMAQEFIEAMEKELYPERYKKGSAWIWILVIGVIIVVGLVSFVWWKSKRKKKF